MISQHSFSKAIHLRTPRNKSKHSQRNPLPRGNLLKHQLNHNHVKQPPIPKKNKNKLRKQNGGYPQSAHLPHFPNSYDNR